MKQKLLFLSGSMLAIVLSTSNAIAQYCIPTYNYDCTSGDDINTFTLFGSGIDHQNSGCSLDGYGDYTTDPGLVGNLEATTVYNFHITHNYMYNEYVKIYIDIDNNMLFDEVTELFYSSPTGTSNSDFTDGSITMPSIAPVNGLRMRVMVAYSGQPTSCGFSTFGETHDYTVNILPPPTCSIPGSPGLSAITAFTADIDWNAIGNGIGYNMEWGTPGFTPGTGSEIGSQSGIVGTTYQITSLTPSTDYVCYVQTDCDVTDGLSQWAGPIAFTTPCVPVSTLPWSEDFESMSTLGYDVFPGCWVKEGDDAGTDDNSHYYTYGNADANNGTNYMFFAPNGEEYVFTPEFELVAGETYEFEFSWAGDEHDGWDGEIVVSQTQSSMDAVAIGDPFIALDEPTTMDYIKEKYCFTPTADGNYSFGFHVNESYYWYYLNIDDVSLRVASPSVGTDAVISVCEQSGVVNLDDLGQITDFNGSWSYTNNPSALANGNELNVDVIPNTTVMATYWANSCLAPDITATITVVAAPSAGINGTLSACKNQMVDLLGGLGGNFTFGGQWYNASSAAIPSSYINTGTLPGQFNYSYIVGNGGICDDDTAQIILNISNCDYLSIEELEGNSMTVYPNPTTGKIAITGDFGTSNISYSVVSLNGEVVVEASEVQVNGKEIMVDLSSTVEGMYLLKVTTNASENIFRIVKQ